LSYIKIYHSYSYSQEARQRQVESKRRANENKKVFEESGVVRLFEDIQASGIIKYSCSPVYKIERKPIEHYKNIFFGKKCTGICEEDIKIRISDFDPAHIVWGDENKDISLIWNYKYYPPESEYDWGSRFNEDKITLSILSDGTIGVIKETRKSSGYSRGGPNCSIEKIEEKIDNIPSYIAQKIAETLK
jgi:hypothetical protein